jgi:hypothetical protein
VLPDEQASSMAAREGCAKATAQAAGVVRMAAGIVVILHLRIIYQYIDT